MLKIDEQNRIYIPRDIRELCNWETGEYLEISSDGVTTILRRWQPEQNQNKEAVTL